MPRLAIRTTREELNTRRLVSKTSSTVWRLSRLDKPRGLGNVVLYRSDMNYKKSWTILRDTLTAWSGHDAPRLGAALAFYSILSLAPLMILVLAMIGLAFGHSAAQDHIVGQVEGMIGKDGGDAVRAIIEHAHSPAEGAVASVVGIVTLLFGASGVFGELQAALNKMWDVEPKPGGGILVKIREKVFSFGMVLGVGFLLVVSLVLSAALYALGMFFGGLLSLPDFVLSGINFIVSLGGIACLFALIFKYVPETEIDWNDVWLGAVATGFFFSVRKQLIGLYLGKAAVGSAYGAAGSLVVMVVWVYYSAMIFLFGAELTHVLASGRAELPR
jgi:membrane protein